MLVEGTLLGDKLRVVRRLAAGGMGVVYEAEHVQIGRRVAVKMLHGELADDPDILARFQREAKIAGSLGHDNICEVLDVGTTPEGAHYLVMPLLRGMSLEAHLEANGTPPIRWVVDIGVQILRALDAAHRAGVVHRDLKPQNVFITRVGDRNDFVKVLDFGVSKIVGSNTGGRPATRTGALIGTVHYMAPEQLRAQKDQDGRIDIYALGVILYRMLTGRLPFESESRADLVLRIASGTFDPPAEVRPDIPRALESVVLRAMSTDRESRFPDAPSMAAALSMLESTEHLVAGEAAAPKPASPDDTTAPEAAPGAMLAALRAPPGEQSRRESAPAPPDEPLPEETTLPRVGSHAHASESADECEPTVTLTTRVWRAVRASGPLGRRRRPVWLLLTLLFFGLVAVLIAAFVLSRVPAQGSSLNLQSPAAIAPAGGDRGEPKLAAPTPSRPTESPRSVGRAPEPADVGGAGSGTAGPSGRTASGAGRKGDPGIVRGRQGTVVVTRNR